MTHSNKRLFRSKFKLQTLALSAILAPAMPVHAAGSFIGLGFLPSGTESYATGISADGSVVVGHSNTNAGANEYTFRWAAGAMQNLGALAGASYSTASGVSADGAVVVGTSASAAGNRAFRWTQGGGMQNLGTLGGNNSNAYAVSADGSVVVGDSLMSDGRGHAFRWTQVGGMQDLGTLGGGSSEAYGASADGSVVVGFSTTATGEGASFRWTSGGGMQNLGTLPGHTFGLASGVSYDGSVVVGESSFGAMTRAYRWTAATGLVDLGSLQGASGTSFALAVSGNGAVVVGGASGPVMDQAFRWTQATGMQSVQDWLAGAGVTLPMGKHLLLATAVNADGSIIVGDATDASGNTEAYLARVVPANGGGIGSGVINPTRFNASVAEAASRAAQSGAELPSLALFGAHHRSLLDSGLAISADGVCAWATADSGEFNASDNRATLTEVGACKDIGSVRIGLGVGQAWSRQNWSLGGKAEYNGQYLITEIANDFGDGIEGSLTGYYGRFDTDFRRHYMNGANVASSHGDSDVASNALRVRLDMKDALQVASFSLSPYAAYTHIRTRLDGYTETGGGFPVAYSASKWKTDDVRVGVAARTEIGLATQLRLAGEVVHRFDDSTDGVKGQVLGLWAFNLDGEKVHQNWVRATLDIDYKLSENGVLTAGANLATQGGDPSWGVTLGYRVAF